jgi:hypothetical protein
MDSLEKLPCILSASERARKADELAREVSHHGALELEKSLTAKALGEKLKESDRKIRDLAESIRNGSELREVKCTTVKDFEHNVVHTRRLDTKEIVSSRPMQAGERQQEMFAKPSKQLPLSEKFDELGKPEVEAGAPNGGELREGPADEEPLGPDDDNDDDDDDNEASTEAH